MRKSDIAPMPVFFDRYINLVDDVEIVDALERNLKYTPAQAADFKNLKDLVYTENKWTIKDILQHVIDTERIQAYRALRFARKDQTLLPGFDQELFGKSAKAENRTVDSLMDEQEAVRRTTILLFKNFDKEALLETGICFNKLISVLGLGFVIVGHQLHHLKIIQDKYLPLLK